MSVRERLLQRPDVPDEDVDDLVAIAAQLQDEARADDGRATVEDVQRVAGELDIAPEYVEQALGELQRRREEAKAEEEARSAMLRTAGLSIAGVAVCLVLFSGLWVATAVPGLRSTAAELDSAEAQLEVVLDRQAALAPQLVALAGGDASGLQAQVDAVRQAESLDARVERSSELATAMATMLARTRPTDEASMQLRLNLQYEVTGSANRIATERQRVEQARVAYEAAHSGLRASLATGLGLAP